MKKFVEYLEIVFSVIDMLILISFTKKYVFIKNPDVFSIACSVIIVIIVSYLIFEFLNDIKNDIINGVIIKLNNKEDK